VKHTLQRRLHNLEKINAVALRTQAEQATSGPSGPEIIREYLRAHGIEQQPYESLAETTARAMGISSQELDRQLRLRAGL
jgi:hypothetical protein